MEPEGSLPHLQVPAICPYPEPARIGACLHSTLISSPNSDEWSVSHPGRFILWDRDFSANWIEGWVGPRPGLDGSEKRKISCSCREFEPRTMRPVA